MDRMMPPMGMPPMPPPGMAPALGPMPALPPGMPMGGGMPMPPMPGMPGMMPPPPMGMPPMGMDPMAGIDPTMMILMQEMDRMESEKARDEKREARRKPWQKPKKPSEQDMLTLIRQDQTAYEGLVSRFAEHLAYLDPENPRVGVPEGFDEDVERYWVSSMLRDEENIVTATLGEIDVTYLANARTSADRDEAVMKEDFLYYLRDEALRQFADAGMGSRPIAEAKNVFRYGRAVARNTLNLDAQGPDECAFHMHLLDPATCFPHFEGARGMTRMTRVYRQTVGECLGDHDDAKGSAEKKLLEDKKTETTKNLERDTEIEVCEFWDCKYYAVFAAGVLIKGPVAHDYGEPPFVYRIVETGDPSNAISPTTRKKGRNNTTVMSRREDLKKKGQSAIAGRLLTHAQREIMLGRLYTEFMEERNPALIVKQGLMGQADGPPEIVVGEGGRSYIQSDDDVMRPPKQPIPATFGPLSAASAEDNARSSLPPAAYGVNPQANTSGYAIEGLNESGKDKLAPIVACLESFHSACAEQLLRFYRDWGHLLGEDGSRGAIIVPRQQAAPDEYPTFELTPEVIERTGTRCDAELSELRLQTMNQVLNMLGMARSQGLITRYDAIRFAKLPGHRDPFRVGKEIDLETLKELPEYKMKELLKYVVEVEQDPQAASFILKQMRSAAGGGGGSSPGRPPTEGPPPGTPPPGQGAPPPGLSLPGMGMPPGPGSGPPGPLGPRPGGPEGMVPSSRMIGPPSL
jgi:hypothetical protein